MWFCTYHARCPTTFGRQASIDFGQARETKMVETCKQASVTSIPVQSLCFPQVLASVQCPKPSTWTHHKPSAEPDEPNDISVSEFMTEGKNASSEKADNRPTKDPGSMQLIQLESDVLKSVFDAASRRLFGATKPQYRFSNYHESFSFQVP